MTDRRPDTVNCIHDKQHHIISTLQAKREHNIYGVNVMKINSEFPLPSSLPQSIYWNETSGHPLAVINQAHSAE